MSGATNHDTLLTLTGTIVSAHVSSNAVTAEAVPSLIRAVYHTLADIGADTGQAPEVERPEPAVNPKKSVFPDYIICLEDGQKLKMLRRYLKARYKMTPEQYRDRWELASNYPMVAPNYAKTRSVLAKSIGLGRKPQALPAERAKETASFSAESPEPKTRAGKAPGLRKGVRVPRQAASAQAKP